MGKKEFIKKFDSIFKTNFHIIQKEELNKLILEKKKELELKNSRSLNLLIILAYAYLERRGFIIGNENQIEKPDKKVISELKKTFKKPLICEPKNKNFLLIVTKKTKKDVDAYDLDKLVKVYKGSDIIYLDKRKKKLVYTKGDAAQKMRNLFKEEKISVAPTKPKSITFDPFEKIFTSRDLDIFEVEFRSINFPSLKGLYIKTGSKQDKINKKIREIRKILLAKSLLRVSNIKSIHLGLKGCDRKDSSSLIITSPKKLGIYNIRWRGKAKEELDIYIRNNILKDLLYIDLIDGNVPYGELILNNFLNKDIPKEEYEKNIKPQLKKWDRFNLLKYESKVLKPNYSNTNVLIKNTFHKDYSIEETEIEIKKKLTKRGLLMKNKKSGKEIFIFMNKRNTSKEDIDAMINKEKPILIMDFSTNLMDQTKRFNFLRINEEGINDFIGKVKDICDHGIFYRNQRERFVIKGQILDNIYTELLKRKTSYGKGSLWESICEDLLDYIFNRSFKLSGPNLPDGRTYWSSGNEGFLWDAKALMKSDLKESILTKSKKLKDFAYINVFRKKIKLDYYIYLSCGVSETEFLGVKKLLEKNYKGKAKFSCITENALKNLKNIFLDEERSSMLHKNHPILVRNIKELLNRGYVNSINLNDLTKGMVIKDEINTKKLRAGVKKEIKKLKPIIKKSPHTSL